MKFFRIFKITKWKAFGFSCDVEKVSGGGGGQTIVSEMLRAIAKKIFWFLKHFFRVTAYQSRCIIFPQNSFIREKCHTLLYSLPADFLSFHLSSGLMEVISGPGMMKWSSFQKQQWAYCRGNVSFHSLTHSLNRLSCGTFIKRFYSLDCPRRRTMSYSVACCSLQYLFFYSSPLIRNLVNSAQKI